MRRCQVYSCRCWNLQLYCSSILQLYWRVYANCYADLGAV